VANAIDLTLASTVAGDLGVTADATVDRVVSAASRAIARYCGRVFEKATGIVEYPAGYGRPLLLLDRAPILGITSIVERGSTVDPSLYEAKGSNLDGGIVYRLQGVWANTARLDGRITDTLALNQGRSGVDGITVTYDAGFVTPGQVAIGLFPAVTLPEDVQEAAILTAVAMYRRRGIDPNVASESLGDWSVSYQGTNTAIGRGGAIPETAQALVASYVARRVV
jgi:hypothetical protein